MSTTLPLLDSEINAAIRRRLGELCVNKEAKKIRLPLKSVSIESTVADRIAEVKIEQQFHNPFSDPLEAVYIFPLSGGCAVSSFELKVADQVIVGQVRERQKARQEYQKALSDGKRAALLEQERDDVFTVCLGNLPAGDSVCVTIKYSEKLPYYDDGTTEMRLPLVVASRYIPGSPLERDQVGNGTELDTDQVPDASRITPARLAAGVKPDVDLRISVKLLNQTSIEDLCCSQHATKYSANASSITISLSRTDELLDRDFVLRWRVSGEEIKPRLLVYASKDQEKPAFAMLSLLPPKNLAVAMPGRDIIFLLDRSGSMQGVKMVSAVRACSNLIATLGPRDRFAIQAFDNAVEWMPTKYGAGTDHFVVADQAGIECGTKYLRTIDARGGTELDLAVRYALQGMKNRDNPSARSPVIVLLTDGQVGNESAILKNIQTELCDNRIFTIGIDTAINDGFLKRLAALAGGTCTFVQPGTEQLEEALSQVGREIGRVIVTDIKLASASCTILSDSIAPRRIPDLYEGRATTCFFQIMPTDHCPQPEDATVAIYGKLTDGSSYLQTVKAERAEISALSQLWAKAHVLDLEDDYRISQFPDVQHAIKDEIVKQAVEHMLLTKFTAFVAVHEEETVSDPSRRRTIVQAVHEAQGWESAPPAQPQQQMYRPAAASMAQMASMPQMPPMPQMQPMPQMAPPQNPGFSGSSNWGAAPAGWGADPSGAWGAASGAWSDSAQEPETGTWRAFSPASKEPSMAKHSDNRRAENSSASNRPGTIGGGDDGAKVRQAYELLDRLLEQAYKDIKANRVPDLDKIEQARISLLDALAGSSIAPRLPLLEKFLRATLVELIASSWGDASSAKKVTLAQVMVMGRLQAETWKLVRAETAAVLQNQTFWEYSL